MTNKYGRQIFLTREEINHLKSLVGMDLMTQSDNIRLAKDNLEYHPDDVFYQRQIDEAEKLQKVNESLDKKLWYYITREEFAARQAAEDKEADDG